MARARDRTSITPCLHFEIGRPLRQVVRRKLPFRRVSEKGVTVGCILYTLSTLQICRVQRSRRPKRCRESYTLDPLALPVRSLWPPLLPVSMASSRRRDRIRANLGNFAAPGTALRHDLLRDRETTTLADQRAAFLSELVSPLVGYPPSRDQEWPITENVVRKATDEDWDS